MAGDLMALGNHALDISSPGLGAIVDHALAYVVTSNKESSHHLISLENV